MKPDMDIYQEERPWGNFRKFTDNTPSTVKIITIKPNEQLSLQSHAKRSEFWKVVTGSGSCDLNGEKLALYVGDEVSVPVGTRHRLVAYSDGMQILEIATGFFDENDIIRYEDKYGRV